MRLMRYRSVSGVLVIAVVIGTLVAFAMHEISLYLLIGMRGDSQVVHVPRWLPYLACAVAVGCGIGLVRTEARVLWPIMILSVAAVVLSVRVIEVDRTNAEVSQYWSDIRLSQDLLVGRNDLPYCYRIGTFFIYIDSGSNRPVLRYFRGVWPATFSRAEIQDALTFKECP